MRAVSDEPKNGTSDRALCPGPPPPLPHTAVPAAVDATQSLTATVNELNPDAPESLSRRPRRPPHGRTQDWQDASDFRGLSGSLRRPMLGKRRTSRVQCVLR